jgi:opacity protein-like surface antigen
MRKKSVLLSLAILCIFILTTAGSAQDFLKRFSLKLTGGYGSLAGGDVIEAVDGLNSQLEDLAAIAGLPTPGEVENAKWGLDFEGELVFSLSKNFGVSLGAGYLVRKIDSIVEIRLEPIISGSFLWEPKYTVIPVTLSGYYYFPVASKANVFFKAGIGYYFAKINFKTREELVIVGELNEWDQNDAEAKDNGFGFHGGLGFEYNITGSVALYAEGIGRYINLKEWEVDNTYRDSSGYTLRQSGSFWYEEEFNAGTGKYYPSLTISEQRPSSPWIRNARKAEIDLSGLSFRIGVRIKFGK